jgi:hypothetical protein
MNRSSRLKYVAMGGSLCNHFANFTFMFVV